MSGEKSGMQRRMGNMIMADTRCPYYILQHTLHYHKLWFMADQ